MHAVQKANEKLGALASKAPAAALAASSLATAFGISAGVCAVKQALRCSLWSSAAVVTCPQHLYKLTLQRT